MGFYLKLSLAFLLIFSVDSRPADNLGSLFGSIFDLTKKDDTSSATKEDAVLTGIQGLVSDAGENKGDVLGGIQGLIKSAQGSGKTVGGKVSDGVLGIISGSTSSEEDPSDSVLTGIQGLLGGGSQEDGGVLGGIHGLVKGANENGGGSIAEGITALIGKAATEGQDNKTGKVLSGIEGLVGGAQKASGPQDILDRIQSLVQGSAEAQNGNESLAGGITGLIDSAQNATKAETVLDGIQGLVQESKGTENGNGSLASGIKGLIDSAQKASGNDNAENSDARQRRSAHGSEESGGDTVYVNDLLRSLVHSVDTLKHRVKGFLSQLTAHSSDPTQERITVVDDAVFDAVSDTLEDIGGWMEEVLNREGFHHPPSLPATGETNGDPQILTEKAESSTKAQSENDKNEEDHGESSDIGGDKNFLKKSDGVITDGPGSIAEESYLHRAKRHSHTTQTMIEGSGEEAGSGERVSVVSPSIEELTDGETEEQDSYMEKIAEKACKTKEYLAGVFKRVMDKMTGAPDDLEPDEESEDGFSFYETAKEKAKAAFVRSKEYVAGVFETMMEQMVDTPDDLEFDDLVGSGYRETDGVDASFYERAKEKANAAYQKSKEYLAGVFEKMMEQMVGIPDDELELESASELFYDKLEEKTNAAFKRSKEYLTGLFKTTMENMDHTPDGLELDGLVESGYEGTDGFYASFYERAKDNAKAAFQNSKEFFKRMSDMNDDEESAENAESNIEISSESRSFVENFKEKARAAAQRTKDVFSRLWSKVTGWETVEKTEIESTQSNRSTIVNSIISSAIDAVESSIAADTVEARRRRKREDEENLTSSRAQLKEIFQLFFSNAKLLESADTRSIALASALDMQCGDGARKKRENVEGPPLDPSAILDGVSVSFFFKPGMRQRMMEAFEVVPMDAEYLSNIDSQLSDIFDLINSGCTGFNYDHSDSTEENLWRKRESTNEGPSSETISQSSIDAIAQADENESVESFRARMVEVIRSFLANGVSLVNVNNRLTKIMKIFEDQCAIPAETLQNRKKRDTESETPTVPRETIAAVEEISSGLSETEAKEIRQLMLQVFTTVLKNQEILGDLHGKFDRISELMKQCGMSTEV